MTGTQPSRRQPATRTRPPGSCHASATTPTFLTMTTLTAQAHSEPAPYEWLKGDCLIWDGPRNQAGYGQIPQQSGTGSVHRLAWALRHGPIPPDRHVCHRCDRPACFAELHLFLGTPVQNAADAVAKGRRSRITPRRQPREPQRERSCGRGHPLVGYKYCRYGSHCAAAARILATTAPLSAAVRDYMLAEWDQGHGLTLADVRARFPATPGYAAKAYRKILRCRATIHAMRRDTLPSTPPHPDTLDARPAEPTPPRSDSGLVASSGPITAGPSGR